MRFQSGDEYEVDYLSVINEDNSMGWDWTKVKSALTSAFITAFLGIAGYVLGVGDIYNLDFHTLANIGVLAGLTAVVSLIKSGLTTDSGKFAGSVQVK